MLNRRLAVVLATCAVVAAPAAAQFFRNFFRSTNDAFFHAPEEAEPVSVGDATWFQERVRNGALTP